ncbi:major facilitator superfamily protein (plasmid) [Rhizobium gallicum]|uniref:Major facilitator superfamily protein n=1 Tax=Rhizobium gallicum TaxID=56730 RepID=A0A1L5NS41_9HYPH|nr:MFS transporter [Rhizobium gallicum]APO70707.1 major facilitator superfamily protein [Rhizobium gallicum]
MTTTPQEGGEAKRPFLIIPLLVSGNFLSVLTGYIVIGFLPTLQQAFGLSAAEAGFVVAAFSATYAISSPLMALIGGYLGYPLSLSLAMATCGMGALVAAFSSTIDGVIVGRVLSAFGSSLYSPAAAALAVNIAGIAQRGRALSYIYLGISLSQVLGIPAGALLASELGWPAAFLGVAGMTLLVAPVLFAVIPRKHRPVPIGLSRYGLALRSAAVRNALLLTAIISLPSNGVYAFLASIFGSRAGASEETLALLLSAVGVGVLVGTIFVGRALDRIGALKTLVIVLVATAAILAPITYLSYDFPVAIGVATLLGAALFTYPPALQHRLSELAPEAASVLFPLNASMLYVGAALGPLAAGYVIDNLGLQWLGPITAIMCLAICAQLCGCIRANRLA